MSPLSPPSSGPSAVAGAALSLIANTVLGAPAASIDFNPIAGTFTHLLIEYYLRSDVALTSDNLLIRFNNDGGANYDQQTLRAFAATPVSNEQFAQSAIIATSCVCGANAPANVFAGGTIRVASYANATNNKDAEIIGGAKGGTTTGLLITSHVKGYWRSNAAITRVTLLPNTGNFVAGSQATLYGLT